MSKTDKREQRIRNNTTNVSIEDFEALILQYGRIEHGEKHPKARIGNFAYSYKRENPVASHYVKSILNLIDELNGQEDRR